MRCKPHLFILLLGLLLAAPARAQEVIPIADAREQGVGATVTVEGTVTRAYGDFVRFQDASGATGASALVIRRTSGPFHEDIQGGTIQPGTVLQVTGTLSEFNGLLQINEGDLAGYSATGQGNVPEPQTITLRALRQNGEAYESELVRVAALHFPRAEGVFAASESYGVADGVAALTFRVQGADETAVIGAPIPAGRFTYAGVTGEFNGAYQLIPVRPSDLRENPSVDFTGRDYTLALEADDVINVTVRAFNFESGQQATVTASTGGGDAAYGTDVTGPALPTTFMLSAGAPSHTLTFDPADDADDEGVERLEITLASDDAAVAPGRFTLWILDSDTATTTLYAGLEGQALLDAIQQDFGSPPTLGYDVARDTLYAVIYNEDTPADGLEGDVVEGYYTDYVATLEGGDPSQDVGADGINTEHTWPQSKGAEEEPATSNLYILVPARDDVNSARSNYPYADVPDEETDSWFFEDETRTAIPEMNADAWSEVNDSPSNRDARRFEPREVVKGDIARKLLYFRTIYPERADRSFFSTQLLTLLRWNEADAPSAEEVRRNVLIASYQGNELNPFVLDPSLADRAFGGTLAPISIAAARDEPLGTTVTIESIVTRIDSATVYTQDGTGGLAVFDEGVAAEVGVGDRIRVTGTLDVFAGLLEITGVGADGLQILSSDNPLPEPQAVSLAEISENGEQYESTLVRVEGITFENADGTFEGGTNYAVSDGSGGEVELRVPEGSFYVGQPISSGAVTFTGALGQFNGEFDSILPHSGYQLLALREGDIEQAIEPPDVPPVIDVDIRRTFPDPDDPQSYRLVALPGAVDRPLARTLDGLVGRDWQAYWDNGAATDYLVKWDGSDRFRFRPGRGFWLISEQPWTVQQEIATLPLTDGAVEIPLRDGWNIISNPLGKDVSWSALEAANGGSLQALWAFDGSFDDATIFASAATGHAYYFLNSSGLDALVIPYPTGEQTASSTAAPSMLTLTAYRDGRRASAVRVGTVPGARDGLDTRDLVAPPGRFVAANLRLEAPEETSDRHRWLAQEVRTPGGEGQRYDLVLHTAPGRTVTLRASGLASRTNRSVVLVDLETGRPFDLLEEPNVRITPTQEAMQLRLLVGSAAFVAGQLAEALPDELKVLPNRPNPFRRATRIEYVLPETRHVRVTVYDVLGRRVRVLVDERQSAGAHTLTWNGRGASGTLASGVYFIRFAAGDDRRVQKVVLLW